MWPELIWLVELDLLQRRAQKYTWGARESGSLAREIRKLCDEEYKRLPPGPKKEVLKMILQPQLVEQDQLDLIRGMKPERENIKELREAYRYRVFFEEPHYLNELTICAVILELLDQVDQLLCAELATIPMPTMCATCARKIPDLRQRV